MSRIHVAVLSAALGLAVSCEQQQSDSATPDDAQAGADAQAQADAEAKQKAEEEAAAKEEEERKAREARDKRIAENIAKMEAEYAKEGERWDAKLKKKTAKLTARTYKTAKQGLEAAMKSPHREPNNAGRDKYRHPVETMEFFGLTPEMTVVEISPGAGWYTELLAPVLAAKGKLVIPVYDPKSEDTVIRYFGVGADLMLGKSEELYGKVQRVVNTSLDELALGEDGSADMVLVFRMLHNWHRNGKWDSYIKSVHSVLKPGGVLAVIQHRAPEGAQPDESAQKGYLSEAFVIEKMEAAGFELAEKYEINANAKDTKDYPGGVWTLPPTLAKGEEDRDKWLEIGESDRMTLKFVKK